MLRRLGELRPPPTREHSGEQAYVSTEQPTSAQDARVPAADADARRACHRVWSQAQGPLASGCLICHAVLSVAHRLRSSREFTEAVRCGCRAGTSTVAAHLHMVPGADVRVGFVVSRRVGDAVTRNRVRRRLAHLVRPHLSDLPAGARLVLRALEPAASASIGTLSRDVDFCLRRARSGVR